MTRQALIVLRALLIGTTFCPLAGCGVLHDVSAKGGEFVGDHLPVWAGGLPKDVPPRPNDPGYQQWVRKIEGKAEPDRPKEDVNTEAKAPDSKTQ
jgi:hypothetical protein